MRYGKSSPKRVIIITISCILVAVVAVAGILYAVRSNAISNTVVDVEQVMMVSTTYWGDQSSTYGTATSDFVQEVYPNTDTSISEIFVKEGQEVKIGDVLLKYDTTKLELNVESKKLEVEKEKYELDKQKKELVRLQNTKPYSPPAATPQKPEVTPTPVPESTAVLQIELNKFSKPFKGSGTPEDPYVFLCTEDCVVTRDFFLRMLGMAVDGDSPSNSSGISGMSFSGSSKGMLMLSGLNYAPKTPAPIVMPLTETGSGDTGKTDPNPSAPGTTEPDDDPTAEPSETPEASPSVDPSEEPSASPSPSPSTEPTASPEPSTEPGSSTTPEATPTPTPEPVFVLPNGPFAVRIEVHVDDNENLPLIRGWAMDGVTFSAGFLLGEDEEVDPDSFADGKDMDSLASAFDGVVEFDANNSRYTAAELKELIAQAKQQILDSELSIKQAELDLRKAELELDNATVISSVNGTVRSLTDLETALFSGSPFLVVSGGDGFYVTGSISEALIGRVKIGDSLTASSWETGGQYEAEIVQISEYPQNNGGSSYDGVTNPNSSSYSFTAFIPEADGLKNDMWLDIILQAGADSSTPSDRLYLYRAYLRGDDNGRYVLKVGADRRIHKEYIETGKTVYSDYVEIKSDNLKAQDYIAFPYGTNAVEGARANLDEDISLGGSEEVMTK